MSTMIRPGDLVVQDPEDALVYTFDWGAENLAANVTLVDAGVLTLTAVSPREDPVTLAIDEHALVSGNRAIRFRVSGGRVGTRYNIAHRIVTTEDPPQTKERSFDVLIQDR